MKPIAKLLIIVSVIGFIAVIAQILIVVWLHSMMSGNPTREYWEPVFHRLGGRYWELIIIPWFLLAVGYLVAAIRARHYRDFVLATGFVFGVQAVLYLLQLLIAWGALFERESDADFTRGEWGLLALGFTTLYCSTLFGLCHKSRLCVSIGAGMLLVDPLFFPIESKMIFIVTWACGIALASAAVHRWLTNRRWLDSDLPSLRLLTGT